ncbi:MAG: hypothetical protein RIT81_16445 [Deltaproteobacteria bacterium]
MSRYFDRLLRRDAPTPAPRVELPPVLEVEEEHAAPRTPEPATPAPATPVAPQPLPSAPSRLEPPSTPVVRPLPSESKQEVDPPRPAPELPVAPEEIVRVVEAMPEIERHVVKTPEPVSPSVPEPPTQTETIRTVVEVPVPSDVHPEPPPPPEREVHVRDVLRTVRSWVASPPTERIVEREAPVTDAPSTRKEVTPATMQIEATRSSTTIEQTTTEPLQADAQPHERAVVRAPRRPAPRVTIGAIRVTVEAPPATPPAPAEPAPATRTSKPRSTLARRYLRGL